VSQNSLLGDYLRARRELVTPEDVGLQATGIRRVTGLRREEVAMLAGISSDYYLRLEQGRDHNPSIQVLEALARVLLLDQAGIDYLLSLATPAPRRRARRPKREHVPASIAELLDTLRLPAFVEGRYFDVLAANSLARALSPNLQAGHNVLRSVFLDPAEKALYPDWTTALRSWSPACASRRAPTPRTHVSSIWWANCRCPASDSDSCGPATTFDLSRVCRPASTTPRPATSP
jgi:transcriptional regulator with XRE-family HTH domain